jgi:hypothetical protein
MYMSEIFLAAFIMHLSLETFNTNPQQQSSRSSNVLSSFVRHDPKPHSERSSKPGPGLLSDDSEFKHEGLFPIESSKQLSEVDEEALYQRLK